MADGKDLAVAIQALFPGTMLSESELERRVKAALKIGAVVPRTPEGAAEDDSRAEYIDRIIVALQDPSHTDAQAFINSYQAAETSQTARQRLQPQFDAVFDPEQQVLSPEQRESIFHSLFTRFRDTGDPDEEFEQFVRDNADDELGRVFREARIKVRTEIDFENFLAAGVEAGEIPLDANAEDFRESFDRVDATYDPLTDPPKKQFYAAVFQERRIETREQATARREAVEQRDRAERLKVAAAKEQEGIRLAQARGLLGPNDRPEQRQETLNHILNVILPDLQLRESLGERMGYLEFQDAFNQGLDRFIDEIIEPRRQQEMADRIAGPGAMERGIFPRQGETEEAFRDRFREFQSGLLTQDIEQRGIDRQRDLARKEAGLPPLDRVPEADRLGAAAAQAEARLGRPLTREEREELVRGLGRGGELTPQARRAVAPGPAETPFPQVFDDVLREILERSLTTEGALPEGERGFLAHLSGRRTILEVLFEKEQEKARREQGDISSRFISAAQSPRAPGIGTPADAEQRKNRLNKFLVGTTGVVDPGVLTSAQEQSIARQARQRAPVPTFSEFVERRLPQEREIFGASRRPKTPPTRVRFV